MPFGDIARRPVNAVDVAQQELAQRARWRVAAGWPGELGFGGVRREIGRDEDHELALLALVVVAAEERAKHGQVLDAGHALDALARLVRQQAGHRQRAAAWQLERGLG